MDRQIASPQKESQRFLSHSYIIHDNDNKNTEKLEYLDCLLLYYI